MRPLVGAIVIALSFLSALPARAAPPARAVFRRSCADCADGLFCEFAYPGAPEDHVACVQYGSSARLFRRYMDSCTYHSGAACGGGDSVLVDTVNGIGPSTSCYSHCVGTKGVASLVWDDGNQNCYCYSSCTVVSSGESMNTWTNCT